MYQVTAVMTLSRVQLVPLVHTYHFDSVVGVSTEELPSPPVQYFSYRATFWEYLLLQWRESYRGVCSWQSAIRHPYLKACSWLSPVMCVLLRGLGDDWVVVAPFFPQGHRLEIIYKHVSSSTLQNFFFFLLQPFFFNIVVFGCFSLAHTNIPNLIKRLVFSIVSFCCAVALPLKIRFSFYLLKEDLWAHKHFNLSRKSYFFKLLYPNRATQRRPFNNVSSTLWRSCPSNMA